MDNVSVSPEELIYKNTTDDVSQSRGRRLLRHEQKSMALLRQVIEYYTLPGDLVMDMCAGTFSTARACFTLEQPRRFVGCEKDGDCFQTSLDYVLADFFTRVAQPGCPIQVSGLSHHKQEILDLQTHVNSLVRRSSSPRHTVRVNSANLHMYQRFSDHITEFIGSVMNDHSVLDNKNKPFGSWARKPAQFLNAMDPNILLGMEAAKLGLIVCNSSIKSPNARRGVRTLRSFKKGEPICSFYGTLAFTSWEKWDENAEYGTGLLLVTKERFKKYGMEMQTVVQGVSTSKLVVFVIPAPFCVGSIINDPRYTPSDEDYGNTKRAARTANVEIPSVQANSSQALLYAQDKLMVIAKRNIRANEELYIDYCNKYCFESQSN